MHTRHHVVTPVGINSLSTLVTIVTSKVLGTTCTWLTHELLEMGLNDYWTHLLVSMDGAESSKTLASSTDLSISRSKLKWAKHDCKESSLRFERKVLWINVYIRSTSTILSSALWGCLAMLKMFSSIIMLLKDNYIFSVLY